MVRDTNSLPKSWTIVAPSVKRNKNTFLFFATVGFVIILFLTSYILFKAMTAMQQSKPFTMHLGDLAFLLCVSAFVLLPAIGVSLRDRHSDLILSCDSLRHEVILAQRRFGRITAQWRYSLSDVECLQVHQQATFTGNKTIVDSKRVWWMAQMVLTNGQGVYLHGIRGKPESPPSKWLGRFSRASELIGKPLKVYSFSIGAEEYHAEHPAQQIVSELGQQRVNRHLVRALVVLVIFVVSLVMFLIHFARLLAR